MKVSQQCGPIKGADCEVRFDDLTRQLYTTDASIYQIEPVGVAFPRSARQASSVMKAAAEAGVPVIPRGAGTGLAGGAVGSGLIIELARNNRGISDLDLERRTVRVGSGVVLDQLNDFLRPHGLWFGPDVATSARATLGGMISSNSSGAHAPVYGATIDHVASLEIVLADGRVVTVGTGHDSLPDMREEIGRLIAGRADLIRERFHKGTCKAWPGYGLDRWLRAPGDLCTVIAGSEGTLASIVSAVVRAVPLPRQKGLGLLFFASVAEAMQATVELLDLRPSSIEHLDRVLFDQTKGQLAFKPVRDLLRLDEEPCESILIVEFFEDVEERLATLAQRKLGLRRLVLTGPEEMEWVWSLRKAGLSLLTGCKGAAKPIAGIEDTAVRPEQLPEYVAGLQSLMKPLGLEGSFYGHAAAGSLHVRPVVDLHHREDIVKYRQLAEEVSALVRQFKGSIAAEHGVGIARTEFMPEHLEPELMDAMRQIKALFDPKNLMNPGKIFPDGSFRIDTNLRQGAGHEIALPFDPVLAFAFKDESFIGNLEQCNGCGGCRKDGPTMCPTFIATGDEIMSTRGRANVIRAVLEQRLSDSDDPLLSPGLDEALSSCLSCKACTTECPSNVNMALLKAELVHARHLRERLSLRERVVSAVDLVGGIGCVMPGLANIALKSPLVRRLMEKLTGFDKRRPLPPFASERFDRWFRKRRNEHSPTRGRVILWDDTFVRYYDPHVGKAAVAVLEAAGFEVTLPHGRACCGRPAFSVGRLDKARRLGDHNVALLAETRNHVPIVFLEPSCYSMFVDDYRELKIPNADRIAERCFLFEQFLENLLEHEPDALTFGANGKPVAIHAHCHAKALTDTGVMARLAARLPDASVELLDTGCCGMAGAFGMLKSKYDLSLRTAQPLVEKIQQLAPDTRVVASGTSCRHQLEHLTDVRPIHMAELLVEMLSRRVTQ